MFALRVDRPMPDPFNRFPDSGDDARRIGLAFALSIFLHATALGVLVPQFAGRAPWPGPDHAAIEALEVELATRAEASASGETSPPIRRAPRTSAPAPSRAARATVAERAQPDTGPVRGTPPRLAAPMPQAHAQTPYAPAPGPEWWRPTAGALAQAQAAPTVGGDLSSAVAAHRKDRADQLTAAEGGEQKA